MLLGDVGNWWRADARVYHVYEQIVRAKMREPGEDAKLLVQISELHYCINASRA